MVFIGRELPDLARHFVIRLLFVEQPVPQAVVASWVTQTHAKYDFFLNLLFLVCILNYNIITNAEEIQVQCRVYLIFMKISMNN